MHERSADLPPPEPTRFALAHLVFVLERRYPGIADEWVESQEQVLVGEKVAILRPLPMQRESQAAGRRSLLWSKHVRMFLYAVLGAERSRRRRRRG